VGGDFRRFLLFGGVRVGRDTEVLGFDDGNFDM